MDFVFQDLRYAVRSLVHQPSFALLAILTLALGIGANAAMFSVVDGVLLRPLPYPRADRIVSLASFWTKRGTTSAVSGPDFHDWHDSTSSFAAMAYYTFTSNDEVSVGVNGATDYAAAALVTPEFFGVFETPAFLGRAMSHADAIAGAPPVAVISHEFWLQRLGGRTDAIGMSIDFARRSILIVGVMPQGFHFPSATNVWVTASLVPETTSRGAHNYRVVARLKDEVTVDAAKAELAAVAARLAAAYPTSNADESATVIPLQERLVGNVRATLLMLFGAVALVLLIACANIANLLLARATGRASELAVRAALGAGRRRLMVQLVTESAVLAAAAGGVGVLLARVGVDAFIALAPAGLPRLDEVRVDVRVLAFSLAASVLASLVFGVVPALQATRVDLNATLRQGGRGTAGGPGTRSRTVLVAAEIAIALALVVGAALLLRSFDALARVDLGYAIDHRLVAQTTIAFKDLGDARRATAIQGQLIDRLARLPRVTSVAGVWALPGTDMQSNGGYWIDGGPGPDATGVRAPQALFEVVTPRYFATMNVPLRSGRDFDTRDTDDAPRVAIVNEVLERQTFPNGAIGRQIMCGLDDLRFMTIVGVAANVRDYDPAIAPQPEIYMPYEQHPMRAASMRFIVRTTGEPLAVGDAVRTVIRGVDRNIPVRVTTMEAAMADAVATPRFRTWLVSTFAIVALVLAMAGVYGVMAYLVSRRTAEIGVRIAMGATAVDVVRLIVGEGLRVAVAGVGAGLVFAYLLAQSLRGMLFGITPTDPMVFIIVPMALLATATLAAAIPALRATRVDPIAALRAE